MGNQCKLTLFDGDEDDLELNIIKRRDLSRNAFKEIDELKREIMELSLFERNKIAISKYNEYLNKEKKINLNKEDKKREYIEINELLLLNNTNKDIVKLYLNFIKENEKFIKEYNLISYEEELLKYQKLFTIKEMDQIEKNYKKISEKQNFFIYLKNLANSKDYKEICVQANENIKNQFYFNYPIEFFNEELYYYKLYILLNIEIYMTNKYDNEENCKKYINNRIKIANLIIEKDILNNKNIVDSEVKMDILMILILYDSLDDNNESINFNRLLQKKEVTFLELETFVKNNNIGNIYQIEKENTIFITDINGKKKNVLSTTLNKICLKNLKNKAINTSLSPYIYDNLDSLLNENDLSIYIKKIKEFLIKIVNSKVYNEEIKVLFKDKSKYLIEKNISDIEYFINNRIKFYPYQILNISGFTDKLSCYSFIPTISYLILKEILVSSKIAVAIYNILHEINNINQNILYFKGNNISLFNTSKRKGFKSSSEGEKDFEEILFGKKIQYIEILETIYILNEKNYSQTLEQFRNNFINLYNSTIPLEKKMEYLTIPEDGIFKETCETIDNNILKEELLKKGLYSLSEKEQINNIFNKFAYIPRGKCCMGKYY